MQWNLKFKKKIPYSPDPGPVSDTWLQRVVCTLSLSSSSLSSLSLQPFPICFNPTPLPLQLRLHSCPCSSVIFSAKPPWSPYSKLQDPPPCSSLPTPFTALLFSKAAITIWHPIHLTHFFIYRLAYKNDSSMRSGLFIYFTLCFPGIKRSNMPIKVWPMTGWFGENQSIAITSTALESDSPQLE